MARQLADTKVTLCSDARGNLVVAGQRIKYKTCDSTDTGLKEGGVLILDDLIGTDTLDEWWAKVQGQLKKKHSIA